MRFFQLYSAWFLMGIVCGVVICGTARAAPSPDPYSYALDHGCRYVHPSRDAYSATTRLLKHERPVGRVVMRRVHKWSTCVATRAKAHAVHRHVRRLWAWRHSYAHRWPIAFHRYPGWAQSWAWSTGACESGNNPGTSTGNGFYGAFQFMLSTWYAAGGQGNPAAQSWHYQAVIAIRLMLREGAGHWPNCG